jgi:hypothetical protein
VPQRTNELRNGAPSRFVIATQYAAARVFALSARVRRKATNIGEIAGYLSWLREHYGAVTPVPNRERVWERMAQAVGPDPVRGIEFGVAWGYGTGWWLSRISDPRLRWDGFDRFTGLPRDWRDLDEGHFDAQGQTPAIDDSRVTWHVGDVEDNVANLALDRSTPCRLVVLFDLDIYEPSRVAWDYLRPHLQPGDILYFDEAFDADERKLLDEVVLPAGEYEFIAATPMALALQVRALGSH